MKKIWAVGLVATSVSHIDVEAETAELARVKAEALLRADDRSPELMEAIDNQESLNGWWLDDEAPRDVTEYRMASAARAATATT